MNIVQITPVSYTADGVIGGGERLVLYLDKALKSAAAAQSLTLQTTVVSLDGARARTSESLVQTVAGTAWNPQSIVAEALIEKLRPADIVYVHQCMTEVGLFAAAHARLMGKQVFGSDAGAGEAGILQWAPDIMGLYSALHSISEYAALAFRGIEVPVYVIPGPVDCEFYTPGVGERDARLVVGIGRVMPHKGYERTIRALPSSLSLTIVGQHYDAPYLAFLRECARGKNVEFLDQLDDAEVRKLLLRAGVFVHASTHVGYEGLFYHKPELLGLAPLEAIATGTTTLVSNAGALPELGDLPGCHVFGSEAELASLLQDAASGRLPRVEPADMHRAVVERYGLVAVGTAVLNMMKVSASCASSS